MIAPSPQLDKNPYEGITLRQVLTELQETRKIARKNRIRIQNVGESLPEVSSSFACIKKSFDEISEDMCEITQRVSHISEDMCEITQRVSHISEDMCEITQRVSHISEDMCEMTETFGEMRQRVDNLSQTHEKANAQIADDIEKLDESVTQLNQESVEVLNTISSCGVLNCIIQIINEIMRRIGLIR